ncbi:MAG: hypothetical protein J7577_20810 [Sphingobacteriaceae bacterium]|nr:hypothetical protein [Sphingobacteriaceae bacterium]
MAFPQTPVVSKQYPDSLLQVVKNSPSDSLKARACFKLTLYWRDRDRLKSKIYLDQSFKYSARHPYLKAIYYHYLAAYYYPTNSSKSEANYLIADRELARFKTRESYFIRAKGWGNYANLQGHKGNDLLMADILLRKSIPLIKKSGEDEFLAKYYNDLGLIFSDQQQYDKSEKYFLLAISIYKKLRLWDITHLCDAYLNASKNYLLTNKTDLAKQALDKAKKILPKCPDSLTYADYYLVEGQYFRDKKKLNESLESINKGLTIAKQIKDPYEEELLNAQKYKTLMVQGEYRKAAVIVNSILKNPEVKFSPDSLTYYKDLSAIYYQLGESKSAYNLLKKYTVLNDSLNKLDILRKINQLEIKFKTAENQKKIAELNTANQEANLSAKNSRLLNWLLGVISLLILSMFIFGINYYYNQKKISTQQDEIRISNAMIQGQEIERYRVARDLHDGLGNILAVVKFNLWQFAKEKPDTELDEVIGQLDHSVNELRRISHGMMPEMLFNISLEAALKDLCESLTSDELDIDCQFINIESTIPQQTQVSIYRIIQELLTNVVKHAEAKNVFLQCTQNKNIFFITLEDDGKGFNIDQQNAKAGMGLNNIKSRVAYLNGKIEIGPRINQPGTSINIELNVKA